MSADSIVTLGHSSPTAIIVAWALSAFIPLPLIILILLFHYHSKASIRSIFQRVFHHRAASGHQCPFTPSSRTLMGSDGSPQSRHPQVTPSKTGLVDHVCFSPSTPRNAVAKLPESPRAPRTDQRAQRSTGTPHNRDASRNNVGKPLSPSFRAPRRLGFLESRSLPSNRRNKSYACLPSDRPLEHAQPKAEEPSPASYGLRHRRLKHRCVISAILSVVVLLLYVLEGSTIVAAQHYANVRVLSQPNGSGGLGQGKEDEKWLIPWAVYLLIQGGLVVLCVHTVWAMKRQLNDLEAKWTKEKGKEIARSSKDGPKEDAFGDIELQPIKSGREEDRLMSIDGDDSGKNGHNKGKGKERQVEDDDAEEPDWETLGFRLTHEFSQSPREANSLDPPNPPFANTHLHTDTTWEDCNPFGEGSSSDSWWSSSPGSGRRVRPSPLPVSFLPDNCRESQNVYLHTNCQDWGLRSDKNERGKGNQEVLAVSSSESTAAAERRNSWAEEEEERFQSVNEGSRESTPPDQRQPTGPPALPSGIELDKLYSFIDGLPYPCLPLPPRRPRSYSKPSTPTPTTPANASEHGNNNNNNYIFDMSLPTSFATPPRTPAKTPPPPIATRPRPRPSPILLLPPGGRTPANILNRFHPALQTPPISPSPCNNSSSTTASPISAPRPPFLLPSSPYHNPPPPATRPQLMSPYHSSPHSPVPTSPYPPSSRSVSPPPPASPRTPPPSSHRKLDSRFPMFFPGPPCSSPSPPPTPAAPLSPFIPHHHHQLRQPAHRIPTSANNYASSVAGGGVGSGVGVGTGARKAGRSSGKRRSYRRLETGLGTVSEGP